MRALHGLAIGLFFVMAAGCGPTMGDPCTSEKDCAGQLCLNRTQLPGGYCSKGCTVTDANTCPAGSTCFANGADVNVPSCFRTCIRNEDCRTGYTCQNVVGSAAPICVGL
jgi:hypothetical protein